MKRQSKEWEKIFANHVSDDLYIENMQNMGFYCLQLRILTDNALC